MTNNTDPQTIAVLGTGIIGAPIARNLAKLGLSVRAWNRTITKVQALEGDGIRTFSTPGDAVRGASVLITVLKDGEAVREAVEAALPNLEKGAVWLQLSTVGIPAVDELAELAEKNGIVFFDAPVQGTRSPAEQGKLVVLASGPEAERKVAEPIFDAIGNRTIWLADRPGVSSRLKLALNAWVFALTHGAAESLAIARALGVDPKLVVEAVTGSPLDNGYFQMKTAAMLADDYTTSFSVSNGAKDARLVTAVMAGTGVQLDLAEAGLLRFLRAADAGHSDKDIAASFLV